jgi:hypothetical protein
MHYFNNFVESSWVQKYKYTDQTWLVDSLNWEKMSTVAFHDYSLLSFFYNSSFINQHLTTDYTTKLSYLDIMLISTNAWNFNVSVLYNSFICDTYLTFSVKYLSILPIFTSAYQDIFNLILLFSPELVLAFSDYFQVYYNFIFLNANVSACFDSYTNNLNYKFSEGIISFFMFFFFLGLSYIFSS